MKYLPLILLLIGCGSNEQVKDPVPHSPIEFKDRTLFNQDAEFTYRMPTLLTYGDKLIVFAVKIKGDERDQNDSTLIVKQIEPNETILSEIDMGPAILGDAQASYSGGRITLFFSNRPSGTESHSICHTPKLNKIFKTHSDDDGLSWSTPEDLSDELYAVTGARNLKVSPTPGLVSDGIQYLITFNVAEEADCTNLRHLNDTAIVLKYSNGWTIHSVAKAGSNENDYDLEHDTFWARNYTVDSTRMMQLGEDVFYYKPIMPLVHSGMIIHNDSTYVSYPASSIRENMMVKKLGGSSVVLHQGPAGYSNLVFYQDNIVVIYEGGDQNPYQQINVSFLKVGDL